MSPHHADPVEKNIETHPVKLAVAVTIGAIGLVVGIIMLANFSVGSHRIGETDDKANSPEAIARRIAPATSLEVDSSRGSVPSQPAAAAPKSAAGPAIAMAVPAVVPASTATASSGGDVYKASCSVCHATGVAGAPKAGDKAGWGARIAKGKPLLYDHAIKGFNAMPAKGGNPALADDDVKAAVDYLVAQAK